MANASQDDTVSAGREAWARLKGRARKSWRDWVAVSHALRAGRQAIMQATGCKTPYGSIYTRAIAAWLSSNGLDDISKPIRYRLNLLLDNIDAIEAWRGGLSEARRLQLSHPDAIWFNFIRATKAAAKIPASRQASFDRAKMQRGRLPNGSQIRFPVDMVRRVAAVLHGDERLATSVLRAAIRDHDDLLELLPEEPPAKPGPRPHIVAPAFA